MNFTSHKSQVTDCEIRWKKDAIHINARLVLKAIESARKEWQQLRRNYLKVDPGKLTAGTQQIGGLVQMIFSFPSGWSVGESSINFRGCQPTKEHYNTSSKAAFSDRMGMAVSFWAAFRKKRQRKDGRFNRFLICDVCVKQLVTYLRGICLTKNPVHVRLHRRVEALLKLAETSVVPSPGGKRHEAMANVWRVEA